MKSFKLFVEGIMRFFDLIWHGLLAFGKWLMSIPGMLLATIWYPLRSARTWWAAAEGSTFRRVLVVFYAAFFAWLPLGFTIFVLAFLYNTIYIRNYDNDYVDRLEFDTFTVAAGERLAAEGGTQDTMSCGRSAIAETAAHLIDFNVNQNAWIPATLAYKVGPFGLALVNEDWNWANTPWFDNKAAFQRGVHRAVDRVSIELVDNLGRQRGSAARNELLTQARGNLQIPEDNWYVGTNPWGVKQTAWSSYRAARGDIIRYNDDLADCRAVFDARADNLQVFLDRIAKDVGSAYATMKVRIEANDSGWFDTRADNLFWESKGMMYAYYGIMIAARHDFRDVIETRSLGDIWNRMDQQLRAAIELEPSIVSNGAEDALLMPSHLTVSGFYILGVRTNLVELRDILQK